MMDLNINPKKMEAIVSILTLWIMDYEIDYDQCVSKLQDLQVEDDVICWMMDVVNVSYCTNVESHLMERIDDYYVYANCDSSECGHDIYLGSL